LTEDATYGWQDYMVRRILTNPATYGKRVHHGELSNGTWDAILDEETYARIDARMSDPSRKTIRQRWESRMLTGIARCGKVLPDGTTCNAPMGFWSKGYKRDRSTFEREVYTCRNGNHVTRKRRDLENWVSTHVVEMARNGDLFQAEPSPDFQALVSYVDGKRKTLDDAVEQCRNGDLPPNLLAKLAQGIESDIAEAERKMRTHNVPTTAAELMASDNPEAYWESLDTERQREILRATVNVIVYPTKVRGRKEFEPETVEVTPK